MPESPPIFEFQGDVPAEDSLEALPMWTAVPNQSAAAVSFTLSAEPVVENPPTWRVNLPADLERANDYLQTAEINVAAADKALSQADQRIDTYVRQQQAAQPEREGGISFAPTPETGRPLPEQELSGLLRQLDLEKEGMVSYSLGDTLPGGWDEVETQFKKFVTQAQQVMGNFAWVETQVGETLVGRTIVHWGGDFNTTLKSGLDAEQHALHHRTIRMALASRHTLIRTVAIITASAVKISAFISTPGGAVLALPAAWKFISRVRDEYKNYQQIMKG